MRQPLNPEPPNSGPHCQVKVCLTVWDEVVLRTARNAFFGCGIVDMCSLLSTYIDLGLQRGSDEGDTVKVYYTMYLFIRLFIRLSIHPSIYLSTNLSICLSTYRNITPFKEPFVQGLEVSAGLEQGCPVGDSGWVPEGWSSKCQGCGWVLELDTSRSYKSKK